VRTDGGLSPLLRPPRVPHLAAGAVPAGAPRHDRRAEGRALVGVHAPPSPPLLRHGIRPPLADPPQLSLLAQRLVPGQEESLDGSLARARLRALSGAGVARPVGPRADHAVR